MRTSVFKTEAGRDRVRSYYNMVLSQLPFERRYIETTFGRTFLLVAGDEANPAIILLHGSCSNSAFWFPEIMALSSTHRVYAVDIVGEAGNSEEYRPDLDFFSYWMKEVLDALGLERASLMGNSLGGWMALKFATAYPERVSNLVLIASSGIAEVKTQFKPHVSKPGHDEDVPSVDPAIAGEQGIPKEVLEFISLIVENFIPISELPVFSDAELQRLKMPVLFIGGEEDPIIDAARSASRLSMLVPSSVCMLMANCGHVVTNSVEHVISFLAKPESSGR